MIWEDVRIKYRFLFGLQHTPSTPPPPPKNGENRGGGRNVNKDVQ